MANVRNTVRYKLEVPAVSRWKDKRNGDEQSVEGRTRDISTTGAFIYAQVCPPEGVAVRVDMVLATIPNSVRSVRLNAKGHVVRAEQSTREKGAGGFAVVLERVLIHGGDVTGEVE
jgi:PilZ domain